MTKSFTKILLVSFSLLITISSTSALTCANLTKSLSKGATNKEVTLLQQFLYDSGYLATSPNGYYGNGTIAAVKKFQKANKLSQTGTVGSLARKKIKEVSCGNLTQASSTELVKISKDYRTYANTIFLVAILCNSFFCSYQDLLV